MDFIGIGDLHLDGPLRKYFPNLNELICNEVRAVLAAPEANSVPYVFLYGDIFHRPTPSIDGYRQLISLFQDYPDRVWFVLRGNHDVEGADHHSLELLETLAATFKNVHVFSSPRVVRLKGVLVNFLPWPHTAVKENHVNVLHVESKGSKYDTGRETKSDFEPPSNVFCVVGHLHTAQRVGSMNFSGTVAQTSFGEKPKKYFHLGHAEVDEEGNLTAKVASIRHHPSYLLHTVVIDSEDDFAKVPQGPRDYCKLLIKDGVHVKEGQLDALKQILEVKPFKSKDELQILMQDTLVFDEETWEVSHSHILTQWMKQEQIVEDLQGQVLDYVKTFLSKKPSTTQPEPIED